MTQPDHEKGRPGAETANSENTLVDETTSIVSPFELLVADVQSHYLGGLLHCTAEGAGRLLLDRTLTPAPWASPADEMIYAAVSAAVESDLDPSPQVVADTLRRERPDLPSIVRCNLVARIFELYGVAPTAPMIPWHRARVHEYASINGLRDALLTVYKHCGVGYLGDLLQLAETRILPALDAVRAVVA